MPATVTLAELRTSVRFEGDFENSRVMSDARINEVINGAIRRLWDLLLRHRPEVFVKEQTPAPVTVANQATVALAADFYRLRQVEVLVGSDYRRVRPVNLSEAWRFATSSAQPRGFRYRIQANNLVLVPTPTQAWTLRVYYMPTFAELAADGDTLDGINGYEDLVVAESVISLLRREKMPMMEWERERDRLEKEISEASSDLDAGEPFYLSGTGPEGPEEDLWWVP